MLRVFFMCFWIALGANLSYKIQYMQTILIEAAKTANVLSVWGFSMGFNAKQYKKIKLKNAAKGQLQTQK